eukprot:g26522.t1
MPVSAPTGPFAWARWLGPDGNGISRETGLIHRFPESGPKVLWRAKLGTGYSGLSVIGGRVLTMFGEEGREKVVCFDATTGREIWKHDSAADFAQGRSFGPRATPCVDGERVYFAGASGHLQCRDVTTGKAIWSFNLYKKYGMRPHEEGLSCSPLVDGRKLVMLAGTSAFAFDKLTGKLLWRALDEKMNHTTPRFAKFGNRRQLVVLSGSNLVGLDPETGRELWRHPQRAVNCATPVVGPDSEIFTAAAYGFGCQLVRVADGSVKQVYKNQALATHHATALLYQGHLYGFHDRPGLFKCVEFATGKEKWVAAGFTLTVAFALGLVGRIPYVLDILVSTAETIPAGFMGLQHYRKSADKIGLSVSRVTWWNLMLPALAFLVFGLLFVLANPDLLAAFSEQLHLFFNNARQWMLENIPAPLEIGFWILTLLVAVGLLRPILRDDPAPETTEQPVATDATEPVAEPLYPAFRNTLVTVIALFSVYLVFEFKTLWFRVFPEGFYYSGYAHEGAAWLTVALGLATLLMSLIFRGNVLRDPRVRTLRRLAWLWSLENIVLAAAVYHRMFIYVEFNGMTRMRIVGLYGMSAVVVGFILVLWKIAHNHNSTWLFRRHLWTLGIAVYLYSLTPVDTIVMRYNVNRILAGDPAPAVQISVHPIDSDGIVCLLPLLEAENETIREGVRALLAKRLAQAEQAARERETLGWSAIQLSDSRALETLRAASEQWAGEEYRDRRADRLRDFHKYVYQWF